MAEEFSRLFNYVNRLKKRYYKALATFSIYETAQKLRAPNVVGQRVAEENVRVFNDYNGFFNSAIESTRVVCILETAKLFDCSNDGLHFIGIVKFTRGNLEYLNKEEFLKFHERRDRKFVEELFVNYREMDLEALQEVESKFLVHSELLNRVKTYRDQYLAHDDKKQARVVISIEEISSLLKLHRKFWNYLSRGLIFHQRLTV